MGRSIGVGNHAVSRACSRHSQGHQTLSVSVKILHKRGGDGLGVEREMQGGVELGPGDDACSGQATLAFFGVVGLMCDPTPRGGTT